MTDIELALVEYDGNGKYPYCDLVYKGLKLLQSQATEKEHSSVPYISPAMFAHYDHRDLCERCEFMGQCDDCGQNPKNQFRD